MPRRLPLRSCLTSGRTDYGEGTTSGCKKHPAEYWLRVAHLMFRVSGLAFVGWLWKKTVSEGLLLGSVRPKPGRL